MCQLAHQIIINFNRRRRLLQSISRSRHLDTTRFTVVLQYHQALSVESLAVVVLELLHRDGASVIHSSNEAGTFYGKGHIVFGIRTQISIFVQNLNRNETQVFAICLNGTAVGAETNLRRVRPLSGFPARPQSFLPCGKQPLPYPAHTSRAT